ncbi:MAG: Circadian oscillating protein COP23 [Phormidium sp. OSCR]|nr:MAG: Circadian oscillating protein COP23 [Phormidium sp. OSCR]
MRPTRDPMKPVLKWAIATLAVLQLPLLTPSAARADETINSFECRTSDGVNFTVALSNGGQESDPIIVWTSDAFTRAGYPPARRCEDVTERFNSLLRENGNSLERLYLTVGRVNRQSVVCAVNSTRLGCNAENVLFTLSNSQQTPNEVMASLSARTTGTSIQESGGMPYVNLQQLVNNLFQR